MAPTILTGNVLFQIQWSSPANIHFLQCHIFSEHKLNLCFTAQRAFLDAGAPPPTLICLLSQGHLPICSTCHLALTFAIQWTYMGRVHSFVCVCVLVEGGAGREHVATPRVPSPCAVVWNLWITAATPSSSSRTHACTHACTPSRCDNWSVQLLVLFTQ